MVTCQICNQDFKKITNTHLKTKHRIDQNEYLRLFPNTKITDESVLKAISKANKGKSYIQRFGKEKAKKLIEIRRAAALKQFKNIEQRTLRKNKAWKGYKDISGDFWRTIKEAGIKKGLGFNLTIEYIWKLYEKQNGQCALSGLPLVLDVSLGSLNKNGYQKRTASLDRIDSGKGYLKGNVQWVHKDINQMKSNRTDQTFIQLCTAVALHNSK